MEIDKLKKLKYLFSTNENDMRSYFFLIILNCLSEYTKEALYKLPYMILIKSNIKSYNEWSMYCMDLYNIPISIKQFLDMDQGSYERNNKIIQTFFKLEYGNEDITFDVDRWKLVTNIIRLNDKMEQFTGILKSDYNQDNQFNTQFEFNDTILKQILKSLIDNIPTMKTLDVKVINPIEICLIDTGGKQCLDYLEQCFKGRDITRCKKFMNQDNYLSNIKSEVNSMDVCVAADTLVKLGFKSNKTSAICFEPYDSWEKRMIEILQINAINSKLTQYIELLL